MNHPKYFKLDQKSILIFLQNFPTFVKTRLQADASFGIARVWTDGEAGGDGRGEVRRTNIYAAKIFENFAPNCAFVAVFVFV